MKTQEGSAPADDLVKSEDTDSAASEAAPAVVSTSESREQMLEERLAELEEKYDQLSAQMEAEAIERMVQDAENESRAAEEETKPEEREFLAGSLALQKLNPEITFSGDILLGLILGESPRYYAGEHDRTGLPVRAAGLHIQHVLDPYSLFKSAFDISPDDGLHLEELYISWFGLVPSLSFSIGRFRQGFGILNRWHEHDLDQTDYPMALTQVLGEGGLVGDGIQVKWMMPRLWAHANELSLEIVDGTNETLFSGEHFSVPTIMLHLKNYYDLSDATYFEVGLTGMFGCNNKRGLLTDEDDPADRRLMDEPWRTTWVAGMDITLNWTPPKRARYRSVTWRSEGYFAHKERPSDATEANPYSWGVYSYLQFQASARWFMGVRGDVALPTLRASEDIAWDVVPYLTFWQSEFVYLRLEYQYGREIPYETAQENMGRRTDNRLLFQIDFAAGPHKHEKY